MMRLDRGVFTLSLDFELIWGSRDLYARDLTPLAREARVTRAEVFAPLLDLLVRHDICATWATVGHLFLGEAHAPPTITPPHHTWHPGPWLADVPLGAEAEHPAFYGRSLVERLVEAGQDVGSHSFTHPIFGDEGCSREAADSDLARCVEAAADLGVALRSFVFPRNRPGHVDLLAKHGFTCWRGPDVARWNQPDVPRPLNRASHLAVVAAGQAAPTVLPFRDTYGLWCIPGSGSFLPINGVRRLIPIRQRVRRARRSIDHAAREGRISHFWIHPINLAHAPARLLDAMRAIIEHAARLRDRGELEILSMAAVAERAEAQLSAPRASAGG